jgi:cytochrome c-type biogenesis protein CcmE
MGHRRLKFVLAIALLAGAVLWLGMAGFEEGKSYFKTVDEYVRLDRVAQSRRTRLMGEVVAGSIRYDEGQLTFSLSQDGATMPVVYRGTDPVPDTFKDGASALVDGTLGADGRFDGRMIQAKCASKYEADPKSAYGQAATGNGGPAAGR